MGQEMRKLPVGIQSFEQIISDHYLIVDKTEYMYNLIHRGKPYFLSRPRRFGKSLFLSTLRAYWEGKKDLFKGFRIEELERENPDAWQPHPVFYFDFNKAVFSDKGTLESVLDFHLREQEKIYGTTLREMTLGTRFGQILKAAHEQTGKRCVVLVDEYDKPLLEAMSDKELVEHNKAVFKGFFGALKSEDAHIQFVFITGVTKFSKVSIFSDLNQLNDISMTMDYSDICGITEREMLDNFRPEIEAMADEHELDFEGCVTRLKNEYNGYHFHQKGNGVYNPYSLLNALSYREFDAYWFETGTPTFLVKKLKTECFDLRKFTDGTLYATKRMLKDYRDDNTDLVPLLYQTGYLTITGYATDDDVYTIGFPNAEVKFGFLESLLPEYVESTGSGSGKDILTLKKYVENGDTESMGRVFEALFAGITYPTNDVPFEHDFQSVIYIVLTLLGQYVKCEQHTCTGRIDCVIEASKYVYIMEFKRDESADSALAQINEMRYADPYAADIRKLIKIGVSFDSKTRRLAEWRTEADNN